MARLAKYVLVDGRHRLRATSRLLRLTHAGSRGLRRRFNGYKPGRLLRKSQGECVVTFLEWIGTETPRTSPSRKGLPRYVRES